jgi:hypothetical protein
MANYFFTKDSHSSAVQQESFENFNQLISVYLKLFNISNSETIDDFKATNEYQSCSQSNEIKLQTQIILLKFLNMLNYWKMKKYNYKLHDLDKLINVTTKASNDR